MNWLAFVPISMIALWAWSNAFETTREETEDVWTVQLGVCWEMMIVAIGASVASAASLWTA